ncbi:MAG TPA: helix-hairpin-helix domain-containing protein [Candidatus Babeliales bacterium]|nr:helix-hairpin-helix domain-containing protein [Candidatus Babeliales bacterium]
MKSKQLKELQTIPGVGKVIAQDLWHLGIRSINDLKNKNPETLYKQLCDYQGTQVDRCMLYVMRCAVYYASHSKHDPKLLKWWHWKDKN